VHTADTAVRQAMDTYGGPVFVSHGNCRALVDRDRQFSDDQIRAISGRGGVFGVVLDAWMLKTDFDYSAPNSAGVTLHTLVDHVDHFCQIAGSANHVAIGSDLDGGFGFEETPKDFKSISDLHDLAPILADRGYSDADIDAIFWGNWLRFFRDALPK
jgi:membrane dipeptidase